MIRKHQRKNAGFLDSTNQPLLQILGHTDPRSASESVIYTVETIVLVYSNIYYKQ